VDTFGMWLNDPLRNSKRRPGSGKFDMRDLGAVLEHEEPLPHRSEDQEQ